MQSILEKKRARVSGEWRFILIYVPGCLAEGDCRMAMLPSPFLILFTGACSCLFASGIW